MNKRVKGYINKKRARQIVASMSDAAIEKMAKEFFLLGCSNLTDEFYVNWNYNVEMFASEKYFGHKAGSRGVPEPKKMSDYREELLASGVLHIDDRGFVRKK